MFRFYDHCRNNSKKNIPKSFDLFRFDWFQCFGTPKRRIGVRADVFRALGHQNAELVSENE